MTCLSLEPESPSCTTMIVSQPEASRGPSGEAVVLDSWSDSQRMTSEWRGPAEAKADVHIVLGPSQGGFVQTTCADDDRPPPLRLTRRGCTCIMTYDYG